jgi:hypothetical protein
MRNEELKNKILKTYLILFIVAGANPCPARFSFRFFVLFSFFFSFTKFVRCGHHRVILACLPFFLVLRGVSLFVVCTSTLKFRFSLNTV